MASSLFARSNPPQKSQQSNTMQMLMEAYHAGKSPQDVLPQLARKDPTVKQAMDIISGNAPQAVTGIIQNLAAKRGITIPALIERLGIR